MGIVERLFGRREREENALLRGKEILAQVDFAALREIFSEEVRRSGGNLEEMSFADTGSVELYYDGKEKLAGYFQDGKAFINVRNEVFEIDGSLLPRYMLSTLIHEETHAAASERTCVTDEAIARMLRRSKTEAGTTYAAEDGGYGEIIITQGKLSVAHKMLNEAITDTIANEVYDTYLERTGERSRYSDSEGNADFKQSYRPAREVLRFVLRRIAEKAELPEDVVWGAVKQGYFSPESGTLRQFKETLEETVGRQISEMLETAPTGGEEELSEVRYSLMKKEEFIAEIDGLAAEYKSIEEREKMAERRAA